LLTRQIAFEPLPASVLFALGLVVADGHSASRLVCPKPVELHLGQKLRRDRITGAGANNRINAAERAHSCLTIPGIILINPFSDARGCESLATVETTATHSLSS
jgi:hypothetical protein